MPYARDPERAVREITGVVLDFLERPDLTQEQRDDLSRRIMAVHADPMMGSAANQLCLTSRGLAGQLGMTTDVLSLWRRRHCGPPFVRHMNGQKATILYPLKGIRKWLYEMSVEHGLYPDPEVLRAFGLTRIERESEAEAA